LDVHDKHQSPQRGPHRGANCLERAGIAWVSCQRLNKEGTSANADLLAARGGKTWQIQVKGATEGGDGWWVNYGFGYQEVTDGHKKMYNSVDSFYKAEVVVLVSVKSASDYRCVVLPVAEAEKAAQLNLDHSYRNPCPVVL
jgi:hypothetical protein